MKRSCLTIALFLSTLTLASCSNSSISSLNVPREEVASAQAVSPTENFQAAQKSAWDAAVLVQHPPHPLETWQSAKIKWRQAIRLLEEIPPTAPIANQVKHKLVVYRANYASVDQRLAMEQNAVDSLNTAQTLGWQAAITVQNPPHPLKTWQRANQKWAEAIATLNRVSPYTALSSHAQKKIVVYRNHYNEIAHRIEVEAQAQETLLRFVETANHLNALQLSVFNAPPTDAIGVSYQDYRQSVKTLRALLTELAWQSKGHQHPLYSELSAAIADYEFALSIWQSYLRYKQENASWLNNEDLFNQFVPLSRLDSKTLLQNYRVKVYQGLREPKVPLKFTLWEIWDVAGQRINNTQKKAASLS